MGKLIEYIAKETEGKTFASQRFCYDTDSLTSVENIEEKDLKNLREYAESNKTASTRNILLA